MGFAPGFGRAAARGEQSLMRRTNIRAGQALIDHWVTRAVIVGMAARNYLL
jgi:hypothetical protein